MAAQADARHELRSGTYVAVSANNASVCPQQIRVIRVDGRLSALEVLYVGDCWRQGPFEYYCQEKEEEDGALLCVSPQQIDFEVLGRDHVLWRNRPYGIWAELRLQDPET